MAKKAKTESKKVGKVNDVDALVAVITRLENQYQVDYPDGKTAPKRGIMLTGQCAITRAYGRGGAGAYALAQHPEIIPVIQAHLEGDEPSVENVIGTLHELLSDAQTHGLLVYHPAKMPLHEAISARASGWGGEKPSGTKATVCTPKWALEHITTGGKGKQYSASYGRSSGVLAVYRAHSGADVTVRDTESESESDSE